MHKIHVLQLTMTAGRPPVGCDPSSLVDYLRHFVLMYRVYAAAWVHLPSFAEVVQVVCSWKD